jgi:hypothetical protein
MGQSALRDRKTPFRSGEGNDRPLSSVMPASYRKGIGLIFPNPDTEIGGFLSVAV